MARIPLEEIIGKKYGRLTVVCESASVKNKFGRNLRHFKCICDCGSELVVWIHNLRRGNTTSCGCKRTDTINAKKQTPETKRIKSIRNMMLGRCYNPNNNNYQNYGAKGIKVCEEWKNSADSFCMWWLETAYKVGGENLSIERENPSGDYCPENCTLIPRAEQAYNKGMSVKNTSGVTGVRETCDGRWMATWREDGKVKNKSFTIKIYGHEEAFNLAVEARNAAISRLKAKGVPYTEHHGKAIKRGETNET